jgi:hypothetical protein
LAVPSIQGDDIACAPFIEAGIRRGLNATWQNAASPKHAATDVLSPHPINVVSARPANIRHIDDTTTPLRRLLSSYRSVRCTGRHRCARYSRRY